MTAGGFGLAFGLAFTNAPGVRSELYGDSGDAEANDRMFQRLLDHREELEATFGGPLVWDPLEGKRAFRVEVPQLSGSIEETDRWPEFIDWMLDTHSRLRAAFTAMGGVAWLANES